jgi:DNA-binding winged helix-turn-helix (wHTH) protein
MTTSQYSFSRRYWRWLRRVGFTEDPFALFEAEQEGEDLPELFVDRPYLLNVIGRPSRPEMALLMAGRGKGKTATREMVAHECEHGSLRRRALPVRYTEFSGLLERVHGDLTQLTVRHHVEHLIGTIFKVLVDLPATHFDPLDDNQAGLLLGMAAAFADPLTEMKLQSCLKACTIELSWDHVSPGDLMKQISEIVITMGPRSDIRYQSIYILVDCVDETAAGSEAAVPFLKPLMDEKHLLEMPHLAFKFFLPRRVGLWLEKAASLGRDRNYIHTITWKKSDLINVIDQRFQCYNLDTHKRLPDICDERARSKVLDALIETCEGSPRSLLRLCRELFQNHVQRTDQALINRDDISKTIDAFKHKREVENRVLDLSPIRTVQTSQEERAPIPKQGLHIDNNDHVWIDNEPLTQALSPQEFSLLEVLFKRAPSIISHEELIESVWAESKWMTDTKDARIRDEQNLRKLISRLRDSLQRPQANQDRRYIKNVRGRGYWLDVEGKKST